MALTLITTPDLFALTHGGRMLYQFSGTGQFETLGVNAVSSILFSPSAPVPVGTQIPLKYNSQTVVMTAVANPTQPGEFPAGDGSPAYVQSILPYFKGYYKIRKDFTVKAFPGTPISLLELTARQPGAAFSIAPYTSAAPFNLGVANPMGGDPVIRERYGVYIEVFLQKAGTTGDDDDDYELVGGGQHVVADQDGLMQFDVGDLLHGYLSADTPVFDATGGQIATNSHRKYFIAYGEAWGNPLAPRLIVQDQVRHAYLGGADFEHKADGGFSLENFLKGNAAADDRAIRFGSQSRRIYTDEPAWLTFLNQRATVAGVTLSVTLTFDDNSTAAATGIQAPVSFGTGDKLCYPVGVAQRNLLSQVPAGKFLKEYSVKLVAGSVDCSRSYRFIVDYDQRSFRRYFAYQNSLGAFDTISTWGKGSAELLRFSDQAERSLPAFYSPTAGQFVDFNVSRQQQYEVASGWQPQGELVRWDDFYCSSVRYQVGEKILAIGLTSKSIKQQKDGDTTFAHSFSYVQLHRDDYYTEAIPPGEESLPPIAVPVGSIEVLPTLPVLTRDNTISDAVRELTPEDVNKFKIAANRPNPETLGFLTQQSGAAVFRRTDLPIPYADLDGKPTTLEGAGLAESVQRHTTQLVKRIVGIRPLLRSVTDEAQSD